MNIPLGRKALRSVVLAAVATAGAAAALAVTGSSSAANWDWQNLPAGYSVSSFQTVCHVATDPCVKGEGSTCNHINIQAPTLYPGFTETDCVNPSFDADVSAFVDASICTVNPAAGGAACAPKTTTAKATTPVIVPPPPASTPAPAPAPVVQPAQVITVVTPAYTQTVTVAAVTTPAVPAETAPGFTLVEQQIAELTARIQAVEAQLGLIIGEEKNEPPFTNAT